MKTSRRVGYAVVGLGHIAEHAVLPAFKHSSKSKLIAVVSGDEKKARRLAGQFGASDYYTYNDYAFCLSHPQVEAVFVATANSTHAEYTIRAATAGKHVLCEKPMANSVEDCKRMIDTCHASGVRLMIAYRKYFEPASVELKKLATTGKLGRIKIIHSGFTIRLSKGAKNGGWHLDQRISGGGSLVDVGIYCVNTVRWLTGLDPVEASAYAWTLDPNRFKQVEENIAFRLRFPRGLVMEASASFDAALSSFLQIHGEEGWAALNPAFTYSEDRRLFGVVKGKWIEKRFKVMDEFALELDAFSDCIRRGREPEASGSEGLRDVAVMQAIYKSAREGRTVPIPNF